MIHNFILIADVSMVGIYAKLEVKVHYKIIRNLYNTMHFATTCVCLCVRDDKVEPLDPPADSN